MSCLIPWGRRPKLRQLEGWPRPSTRSSSLALRTIKFDSSVSDQVWVASPFGLLSSARGLNIICPSLPWDGYRHCRALPLCYFNQESKETNLSFVQPSWTSHQVEGATVRENPLPANSRVSEGRGKRLAALLAGRALPHVLRSAVRAWTFAWRWCKGPGGRRTVRCRWRIRSRCGSCLRWRGGGDWVRAVQRGRQGLATLLAVRALPLVLDTAIWAWSCVFHCRRRAWRRRSDRPGCWSRCERR